MCISTNTQYNKRLVATGQSYARFFIITAPALQPRR
jgi:hypothetical protein